MKTTQEAKTMTPSQHDQVVEFLKNEIERVSGQEDAETRLFEAGKFCGMLDAFCRTGILTAGECVDLDMEHFKKTCTASTIRRELPVKAHL